MNDFIVYTLKSVRLECGGQVSSKNGASVAVKFGVFDRNVQNKHKNSECSSVIGYLNVITNNSGRYNRFGYLSEKQYGDDVTDVRRVSDDGYRQ